MIPDEEILAHAYNEGRILVTLDKDFGELAIILRIPHCGIMRLVNIPARMQGSVCARIITLHGDELISGSIVTVEANRVRIRPPEKIG